MTPWTAARQASLSFTIFQSLFKPMSIESVMPSNHLVLCCRLLLLPSVFPSIRVFPLCLRVQCYREITPAPEFSFLLFVPWLAEEQLWCNFSQWDMRQGFLETSREGGSSLVWGNCYTRSPRGLYIATLRKHLAAHRWEKKHLPCEQMRTLGQHLAPSNQF